LRARSEPARDAFRADVFLQVLAARNLPAYDALCSHDLPQCREQTLHLIHRVVVHQPDAEKSAGLLDIQMLGQIQRVVIAIPGEEAPVA